jgi:alpha-mannosidase
VTGRPAVCVTLVRGFALMSRVHMPERSGAASGAFRTPGAQCPGEQVMEWSYIPYAASAEEKAPALPEAQRFLYPPVTHFIRSPHEAESADPALLAPLFTVDGPVRYSACKAAQDADAVIVRLFEDEGREATVTVGLHPAVKRASLAQTDETVIAPLTIENGSVTLTFAPYKAVTLRLEKE